MIYISRGKDGYWIVWGSEPKPELYDKDWGGGDQLEDNEDWEDLSISEMFKKPRLGKGKIKKYKLKEIR